MLFGPAHTLSAEVPLTFREAVNRSLERNPELAAYAFELRAQDGRVQQSSARANIEVGLLVENALGLGETGYPMRQFGYRHFGGSRIEQVEHYTSGSTRFTTAAQASDGREFSRNYEGDSGGGVFSMADDSVLIGIISTRRDSHGGVFESVYPHLQWLKGEAPSN